MGINYISNSTVALHMHALYVDYKYEYFNLVKTESEGTN